eukprot:1177484-Amphidinium_carterae.1
MQQILRHTLSSRTETQRKRACNGFVGMVYTYFCAAATCWTQAAIEARFEMKCCSRSGLWLSVDLS